MARLSWPLVLLLPLTFLLLACEEKKESSVGDKEISVTDMFPKRGPFMGGDPVTIKGTGFSAAQGIIIYFGKKKARPPVIKESGEIIVEPPAGETGSTVDVEIEFADSRRLVLPKAYTYYDPTKKAPAE
jgi:hypothetical protein